MATNGQTQAVDHQHGVEEWQKASEESARTAVAQRETANAQLAAAIAWEKAANAQRAYYQKLSAQPTDHSTGHHHHRWEPVLLLAAFVAVAIMAVMVFNILTAPAPQGTEDPILKDLNEIVAMAPNDISFLELSRVDQIRPNGAHEIFITYNPDETARALNRTGKTFVFKAPEGWEIETETVFGTRTYSPGEFGEIEIKPNAFRAYRLPRQ
jgi:hypothetical protein